MIAPSWKIRSRTLATELAELVSLVLFVMYTNSTRDLPAPDTMAEFIFIVTDFGELAVAVVEAIVPFLLKAMVHQGKIK
jgi:hypothetical protein